MANELGIMRGLDLVCRGAVRKLTHRVTVFEKKMKIMVRFVLRRAKEVNGRLDDLEEIAGKHSRCVSSLGRSIRLVVQLFGLMGARIDKVCKDAETYRDGCTAMCEDIEKSKKHIVAIENDMTDNSTDCDAMWQHIRAYEKKTMGLVVKVDALCKANVKLQDKVDALEKLHTTKISAFIYGPTDPDIVQLQNKVSDLENLHSTQIDGAAVNQGPPSIKECQKCMTEAEKSGEVKKF
jgi:hypothetical protein